MADNIKTPAGTGSDPDIRTKDIGGGVHEQWIRSMLYHADDTAVTDLDPVPVTFVIPGNVTTEAWATVTTSSSVVLAANTSRIDGWIKNISDQTIFVSFSGTATTSKPTKLEPEETLPFLGKRAIYRGAISAIHAGTGSKTVEIIEFTV